MSQLKQNQIEYESMKLESSRARADVEDLQLELLELNKLKQIVERNLDEALESLQHEREQKHAFKKELDQRIASESMLSMNNLANLGLALGISGDTKPDALDVDGDADLAESRALKQIEADFSQINSSGGKNTSNDRPLGGDLFSEIHVNEVRKLEELLQAAQEEKNRLQSQLDATHAQLDSATQEVTQQRDTIEQLNCRLKNSDITDGASDITTTAQNASNEISQLQEKIKDLENTVTPTIIIFLLFRIYCVTMLCFLDRGRCESKRI